MDSMQDNRYGLVSAPAWVAWERRKGAWQAFAADDNRVSLQRRCPSAIIRRAGLGPPATTTEGVNHGSDDD
jgi:hypothetical protein